MNETLVLFKIVLLGFNTFIPSSFPLVKAPPKFLFKYRMKLNLHISLSITHLLKS